MVSFGFTLRAWNSQETYGVQFMDSLSNKLDTSVQD